MELKHRSLGGIRTGIEAKNQATAVALNEYDILSTVRGQSAKYINSRHLFDQGKSLPLDQAAIVAQFEAGALLTTLFPFAKQLTVDTPYRAIAFHRQLTFLRAIGILKNTALNGDKLLLGSGSTLVDAYPLWIEIDKIYPDPLLQFLFSSSEGNSDELLMKRISDFTNSGAVLKSFRSGRIAAVEIDDEDFTIGLKWCKLIGIPIDPHNASAVAFLNSNSNQFDFIAMIRMDPLMIGLGPNQQKEFVDMVLSHLKHNGQILITVGSGNNTMEFKERIDAMRYLEKLFNKLGKKVFAYTNADHEPTKKWSNASYMDIRSLVVS